MELKYSGHEIRALGVAVRQRDLVEGLTIRRAGRRVVAIFDPPASVGMGTEDFLELLASDLSFEETTVVSSGPGATGAGETDALVSRGMTLVALEGMSTLGPRDSEGRPERGPWSPDPRELVENLLSTGTNILFIRPDFDVVKALDLALGTSFTTAADRGMRGDAQTFRTSFERYLEVPTLGLALEEQLGPQRDVIVLPRFNGLPVLWIGASSFRNSSVRSVHIPSTIMSIGRAAFEGASGLNAVTLPASLRIIDERAFCGTAVTTVRIPTGTTTIEKKAFADCLSLRRVDLPPDLEYIADDAFEGCSPELAVCVVPGTYSHLWALRQKVAFGFSQPAQEGRGERGRTKASITARSRDAEESILDGDPTSDARRAQVTPRIICTELGVRPPKAFSSALLDAPLESLVHFPRQVVPGSGVAYWDDENDLHEKIDPVAYVTEASERGAALLISDRRLPLADGSEIPTIVCEDPRLVFERIQRLVRAQYSPVTIAITGSIGKTTTKDMLSLVLGSSFLIKSSNGNRNNVGLVGSVIAGLTREHEVYIQETGASYFGQVEALNRLIQPDAFLVTNLGTNHLAAYGESRKELLKDKLSADGMLGERGVAFLNGDDPMLRELSLTHETISFGIDNPDVRYRAVDVREKVESTGFSVVDGLSGSRTDIVLNVIGRHNVYSALGAFAMGSWLGVDRSTIASSLSEFRTRFLRQSLMTIGDRQVLVDCYNASEESAVGAARSLKQIPIRAGGRRVFVFGDLTNRGSMSAELHRQTGEQLATETDVDVLFCFGKDSAYTAAAAKACGLEVFHTEDIDVLVRELRQRVRENDVLGFKASRRMRLEQAVDGLFGTTLALSAKASGIIAEMPLVSKGGLLFRRIPGRGYGVESLEDSSMVEVCLPDRIDMEPVDLIMRGAFADSRVKSVEMNSDLRTVSRDSFRRCRRLRRLGFSESLRVIGQSAFSSCSSLKEALLPDGVHTIGARAFRYCRNLERISLPDSLRAIGENAFSECDALTVFCREGSLAYDVVRSEYPGIKIIVE